MNSLRDSVTGAVTWHLFMDRFEHAVIRSQRRSDALAVARIAVNSRAYPNETVSVLQRGEWAAMVAQRLQSVIRADDTVATLDSERPNEFTLLLEEVSGREAVAQVFSRLLLKLEQPLLFNGVWVWHSVRCGVAVSVTPHHSAVQMLLQADVAYHRSLVALDRALSGIGSTYVLFDRERHGAELARREQASGQRFGALRKSA